MSSLAQTPCIEWAPFRLKPGVSEEALLHASGALQRDFVARQPGFVRRELLRGPGGQWVDLVVWKSRESALAIMDAVAASPACHAYFALMDGADHADPGAGVTHFERVREYAG
jgi:hypothetical protein